MKKTKSYFNRLRQSRALRGMTIIVLWMAMLTSIPQVNFSAVFVSSQIQKILPADSIPVTSPGNLIRATTEYAESFIVVLDKANLERHLHIYTILEQCSSEHARALTSVFIYTQTTSSFL
jgi:hypothetical protein